MEMRAWLHRLGRDALTNVARFRRAVCLGDAARLRQELERGVDPDTPMSALSWDSPLCRAIWNRHAACVDALLEAGARVDQEDRSGWTPLRAAAAQDLPQVVARLLAAGAAADDRDGVGGTALSYAWRRRHLGCMRLLLGAGAQATQLGDPVLLDERFSQRPMPTLNGQRNCSANGAPPGPTNGFWVK